MLPLDYLGEAKRSLSRADGDKPPPPHMDWSKSSGALLKPGCSEAGGKCEENANANWGKDGFGAVVNTWITWMNLEKHLVYRKVYRKVTGKVSIII